jgi:hypothetical protein
MFVLQSVILGGIGMILYSSSVSYSSFTLLLSQDKFPMVRVLLDNKLNFDFDFDFNEYLQKICHQFTGLGQSIKL